MRVIRGFSNVTRAQHRCAIAFGNCDGVHLGHLSLIETLVAQARARGVAAMLATFEPQPREFFAGSKVPARLTRFREKITLLEETGLDYVLCIPFNERTAAIPASWVCEDFLHGVLDASLVMLGDDWRFGAGGEGDFELVANAGARLGYEVRRLPTYEVGGERVSSTRIRAVLAAGDFALAERLLGRPYFIMGRVVYGRQLGRQLGVPTANIPLQRYRAALEGVYSVSVDGLEQRYQGIANIGVRPTVDGKEPLLEVHLFDFAQDIYGRLIRVTFHHKLRDERAFDSLDLLKAQIQSDITEARDWFALHASELES